MGFPCGSDGKESVCDAGDPGSIPGLGRSSGEGNDHPFQYSYLENSVDSGAWRGYSPCGHMSVQLMLILSKYTKLGITHLISFLCVTVTTEVRKCRADSSFFLMVRKNSHISQRD